MFLIIKKVILIWYLLKYSLEYNTTCTFLINLYSNKIQIFLRELINKKELKFFSFVEVCGFPKYPPFVVIQDANKFIDWWCHLPPFRKKKFMYIRQHILSIRNFCLAVHLQGFLNVCQQQQQHISWITKNIFCVFTSTLITQWN